MKKGKEPQIHKIQIMSVIVEQSTQKDPAPFRRLNRCVIHIPSKSPFHCTARTRLLNSKKPSNSIFLSINWANEFRNTIVSINPCSRMVVVLGEYN